MSDTSPGTSATPGTPGTPGTSGATGAGAMLRAAREKQGLHIAALAAAIKVSPRKLDALEHDRWHELPDATFTRALAQTVCRTLKIDARPVLDKLPPAASTTLEPSDARLNEPFRERPGREEPGFAATAVRPMVWGAAALMVAAVAVYLLPADLWSRLATPTPGVAQVVAPGVAQIVAQVVAQVPAPAANPDPAIAPVPAAASAAIGAVASSASAALVDAATVTAPAAASAPMTPAVSVSTPVAVVLSPQPVQPAIPAVAPALPLMAPAPSASGVVQLRTSKASWIEARDARGATLLSRTVLPGESVALDGKLPIRMTIGNASATQLAFRGNAIDLTPSTRDNIARVELQ